MTTTPAAYLDLAVAACERLLAAAIARRRGDGRAEALATRSAALVADLERLETGAELPIHALGRRLGLDAFERRALLLVAACSLDGHVAELAGSFHGDATRTAASPWLVVRALGAAGPERFEQLRALGRHGRLRTTGALRGGDDGDDLHEPLTAAGFVLDALRQLDGPSSELARWAVRLEPALGLDTIPAGERPRLERLASLLAGAAAEHGPMWGAAGLDFWPGAGVLLSGPPGSGKSVAARAMAHHASRRLLLLQGEQLASTSAQTAARVVERCCAEAAYRGDWLVVEDAARLLSMRRTSDGDVEPTPAAAAWLRAQRTHDLVSILTATDPRELPQSVVRAAIAAHELRAPGRAERRLIWQRNVPDTVALMPEVRFEGLAESHGLDGRGIRNALALACRGGGELDVRDLREASDLQPRASFGIHARRQTTQRGLGDLYVDADVRHEVEAILATERVRRDVLRATGLGQKLGRGLGLACLFDGPPGTGKTLAAEVIAGELGLPLFTVNVASIVSKWIGETEKNLQEVFDTADRNRCVLLFDEADTLFARRTGVQGANDRHANLEVGLLLQLVEHHRGLVVLTTNLRENIDPAFARRFAFHVRFDEPGEDIRAAIWRHLLPEAAVSEDELAELAERFELPGGSIRNAVLRACYAAAAADQALGMRCLVDAAIAESRALGKLVRVEAGGDR